MFDNLRHLFLKAPSRNRIVQHLPAYFSGFEAGIVYFVGKQELLDIPFVRDFADRPNFCRYSVDEIGTLFAEYDGGRSWWVVGHLDHLEGLGLPYLSPEAVHSA